MFMGSVSYIYMSMTEPSSYTNSLSFVISSQHAEKSQERLIRYLID